MGRDQPQTASAENRFSLSRDRNRLLVTRIPVTGASPLELPLSSQDRVSVRRPRRDSVKPGELQLARTGSGAPFP